MGTAAAARFGCCVAAVLLAAACGANPPERRPQVDQLTQEIRGMPGVVAASDTVVNSPAQGSVYFEVDVDVADGVSGPQLAAIASHYLDNLRAVDYDGYRGELDVRNGWNLFAVDSGEREVTNRDQIVEQAQSWVAMRDEFRGATIRFRATVAHPPSGTRRDAGPSGTGNIQLPDPADYTAVTSTVGALGARFPQLATGSWTVSAGKQHPADIKTSRRLPTPAEIDVWNRLNADQVVPHIDALTINGLVTGPVWFSEQARSRDLNVALDLARRHLPIVAALPPPIRYTAGDQIQGHLNDRGQAMGPVTVTVGGCTVRNYRPTPAEQALIDTYEKCRR